MNVRCPGCDKLLKIRSGLEGRTVKCPECGQHMQAPSGREEVFVAHGPTTDEASLGGQTPIVTGPLTISPAPTANTMQQVGAFPQFECPYCHFRHPPLIRRRISTGGWVCFAVLLILCWPLFWIGLLITEDYHVCSGCGMRFS